MKYTIIEEKIIIGVFSSIEDRDKAFNEHILHKNKYAVKGTMGD